MHHAGSQSGGSFATELYRHVTCQGMAQGTDRVCSVRRRTHFSSPSAKSKHHARTLDENQGVHGENRWLLVCVAQESFGRVGGHAAKFFARLAVHSAACRGGGAPGQRPSRGVQGCCVTRCTQR